MIAQFGGGDWVSTLIWFIFIFVFMIFGQRLMLTNSVMRLEHDIIKIEAMAADARGIVTKSISKKPGAKLKESIRSFMEFFAVEPVSTDPYGIMHKIDFIIRQADQRFKYFVNQIAPELSAQQKDNIKCALAGAMTAHQIAKILRHFLETVKKYKMLQLAMILQMQLPLIARIAKASLGATRAFSKGLPIGDGIGPLVVAGLAPAKAKLKKFEEEEFVCYSAKISDRDVLVAKASGPGATVGYPGKFLKKLLKEKRINKIITIDAGMRLEGEKTGSIAEGVGVAMSPFGVERYEIEDIAVKYEIPLDAIVIKEDEEEALTPMKKEILKSVPGALEAMRAAVARSEKREKILIMGVGNTCGVGNNKEAVAEAEKNIKEHIKKVKEEEEKKKRKWF